MGLHPINLLVKKSVGDKVRREGIVFYNSDKDRIEALRLVTVRNMLNGPNDIIGMTCLYCFDQFYRNIQACNGPSPGKCKTLVYRATNEETNEESYVLIDITGKKEVVNRSELEQRVKSCEIILGTRLSGDRVVISNMIERIVWGDLTEKYMTKDILIDT